VCFFFNLSSDQGQFWLCAILVMTIIRLFLCCLETLTKVFQQICYCWTSSSGQRDTEWSWHLHWLQHAENWILQSMHFKFFKGSVVCFCDCSQVTLIMWTPWGPVPTRGGCPPTVRELFVSRLVSIWSPWSLPKKLGSHCDFDRWAVSM